MMSSFAFTCSTFFILLLDHVINGAMVITTNFDREFVASEGTSKFFTCNVLSGTNDDEGTLKNLIWSWNNQPILSYDFHSLKNKFHSIQDSSITVNKELSGRERIGLLNLTPSATNGILKCTFQDVFGSKQSKEVLIKVLGTSGTSPSEQLVSHRGGSKNDEDEITTMVINGERVGHPKDDHHHNHDPLLIEREGEERREEIDSTHSPTNEMRDERQGGEGNIQDSHHNRGGGNDSSSPHLLFSSNICVIFSLINLFLFLST